MGIDKGNRIMANAAANVPQKYASFMDETVRKIVERGNDVEIRSSKEGVKVFEVSKKVVMVIPKD